MELSAKEIREVYNMNSHKFFFSFLRSAGMHVTKQDKIVHLTSLLGVGKRVKFIFIIKGVVESMEKYSPPPAPPPAGDIV